MWGIGIGIYSRPGLGKTTTTLTNKNEQILVDSGKKTGIFRQKQGKNIQKILLSSISRNGWYFGVKIWTILSETNWYGPLIKTVLGLEHPYSAPESKPRLWSGPEPATAAKTLLNWIIHLQLIQVFAPAPNSGSVHECVPEGNSALTGLPWPCLGNRLLFVWLPGDAEEWWLQSGPTVLMPGKLYCLYSTYAR